MRGIAALSVMSYHYKDHVEVFGGLKPFDGGGWTAVDLFFVLSGFVLAYTYEPRFKAGLTLGHFMQLRLIRLYPLYAMGTLVAVATQALLVWKGYYAHAMDSHKLLVQSALGMLFVPVLVPGVD